MVGEVAMRDKYISIIIYRVGVHGLPVEYIIKKCNIFKEPKGYFHSYKACMDYINSEK